MAKKLIKAGPKIAKPFLKSGHISFSATGLTFKAYSKKGKQLQVSWQEKTKIKKNVVYKQSLKIPKGTAEVRTYYKGKLVSSKKLRAPLKRASYYGAKRLPGLTQSEVKTPLDSIDMRSRINDVMGPGSFSHIESGYLPNSPYYKGGVFFKTKGDYERKASSFRVYMVVRGESYHGKKGEESKAVHIVSLPYNLKSPQRDVDFAANIENEALSDIKEIVKQHNMAYRNKRVKTRWFGGPENMKLLGIEAIE
jgi:hypothetical protein